MNCYILGVISLFSHFDNSNKKIKSEFKLNSLSKSYEIALSADSTKSELHLSKKIYRNIVLLEKADSTKLSAIKISEVSSDKLSDFKLNNGTEKAKGIVTYRIFFTGKIEKYIPKIIKKGNENKYKYVYIDKKCNEFDLGDYTFKKTPVYRGTKDEFVNLINLEEVPKYFKKGNHQYHFNIDSERSYVNERTLASFFGAMLEVNYLDISCNGFSHEDGSSRPSRSHINGNNGDFKYLRINKTMKCGSGTSLNISKSPDALDVRRQNKWIDALYKFGWKQMLGWSYTIDKKTEYLHHITHKTKNHHHHLHVQSYEPQFKEIKL
ncbi:hypothetical protein HNQ02_001108 [Flavobacterium sp. 7E]|uniref:hypothetical protein n=1 Tax=Flavobacterium sp. 7E TaxID=2735898 RepID=UPI0015711C14|nr:hypothetical protein [Flavobacterium sp. 7E]NRS88194.1 hypothetical protein [Flavobacterium sp. 7E]